MCGSDNPGYLDPSHRNMKPRLVCNAPHCSTPLLHQCKGCILGTFFEDSTLYSLGDMEFTIGIIVLRALYWKLWSMAAWSNAHLQRSPRPV